ncbi:hypothetical protein GCM10010222_06540 [Streptomyces tanashiensis]|nr:hypothetical protein GCM10010222_06540 [Streptomyces tanashiensis]
MREEEDEPRHADDHGGTAARTLTLHAPQDAPYRGIGSAAPALWAIVPQGGTGGNNGRRPCRRQRLPRLNPHSWCSALVVRVKARKA